MSFSTGRPKKKANQFHLPVIIFQVNCSLCLTSKQQTLPSSFVFTDGFVGDSARLCVTSTPTCGLIFCLVTKLVLFALEHAGTWKTKAI